MTPTAKNHTKGDGITAHAETLVEVSTARNTLAMATVPEDDTVLKSSAAAESETGSHIKEELLVPKPKEHLPAAAQHSTAGENKRPSCEAHVKENNASRGGRRRRGGRWSKSGHGRGRGKGQSSQPEDK
jgi:hypothetical protein